jgi:hypothetical protein
MENHTDLIKLTMGYVQKVGQQFPPAGERGAAEKKKKSLEIIGECT